jgi:hypothetical protein
MTKRATHIIDPKDGITAEEVSAAARVLRQGVQPAPAPEPDPLPPPPVAVVVSAATIEPATPATNPDPDWLPGTCINCAMPQQFLAHTATGYACRSCRHTWTWLDEQAPFRRLQRH